MTIAAEIKPRLVYITTSSTEEAEKIARDLIERKLAACANIIPGMRSLYWWEGKIAEGDECVLILKTTVECVDTLQLHVKTLHSYECPAILVLSIEDGYAPFLSWIAQSVSKTG
ncbi:MAG: divalent-cation tolerance protein CutA [Rickettsiales bacterium]